MSGRPIIDGDVHQTLADAAEELMPYLSSGWREFLKSPGFQARPPVMSAGHVWSVNPFGYTRKDVTRDDGALPASSPSYVLSDLIEPFDVQAAVLTGEPALYLSSVANPHYSSELARAYNEHLIDHWLAVDPRFKGSICVELQVPEWAATEVRRYADDPRFVQMAVAPNPLPYGFGHPIYDPVHKACAETGRPFAIHSLGEGAVGSPNSHLASGGPSFYIEYQSGGAQGLMTHVMSFIFHGVFERHPDLKVVLIEPGVTWIPAFLRRLDINYRGIRREVPWCRRSPSEYFHDHFRVTTQPFDIDGPNDDLLTSLAAIGAEDFLLFSSDYPHWDGDEPRATLARVPQHWRDRIAFGNAAELYNLTVTAPAA